MTAVAQFSRGCSGGSSGSYFILIALFLFLVDLRFNFQLQFSSFETSLYIFQDKTIANTDSSHKITESIEQCTELTSKCNAQRKVFDLADIVMERKLVFSLLLPRKSMRITKIMFQRPMKCCYKKILKGWQKESYPISYTVSRTGMFIATLCRVCIFFNENKTDILKGNFVKNTFQNLGKSEKFLNMKEPNTIKGHVKKRNLC